MSTLRLMGNNLWNTGARSKWTEQGLDCSPEARMRGFVRVYQELAPDVIGCQEFNKEMALQFMLCAQEASLPYTMLWGNMTPILYRADKFEVLATEYLLFPKTLAGFAGEFNDYHTKSCNVAVFRDKESGKAFVFVTAHLWWRNGSNPAYYSYQAGSDEARAEQTRLAVEIVDKYRKAYGDLPVVIAGDMNTAVGTPALNYLEGVGYTHAHDAATVYANGLSGYCRCGENGPADKWLDTPYTVADDHIYVKDMPAGAVKRFDRYMPDYYLALSDHAPVYIDVEF